MKEITPLELFDILRKKEDVQVIDIREPYESEICSLGGERIPMDDIFGKLNLISAEKPVILYCRNGVRSTALAGILEKKFHYSNIAVLKGGILSYIEEVDPSMTPY
ncbi:MAG: rhodanese-like domain-containing protein [Bacteroidetes bacterium]|nr:rhodanese-like domain-containing protein [Bacteroidota bacterium]